VERRSASMFAKRRVSLSAHRATATALPATPEGATAAAQQQPQGGAKPPRRRASMLPGEGGGGGGGGAGGGAPAAGTPRLPLSNRRFSDSVAYTQQGNDLLDFIAAGYTEWRVEKPSAKSGKWQRRMLGADLWGVYKETNKGFGGGIGAQVKAAMAKGGKRVLLCGIADVESVSLLAAGGGGAQMTAGGELVQPPPCDSSEFELAYHHGEDEALECFRGRAETRQDAEEIVGKIKHLVAIHAQRQQLESLAKHFPRSA